MNRSDLKKLSAMRLREAKALFKARCYTGAYYIAGYSVECALKACIAKKTRQYEFPDKTRAYEAFQHSPEKLVKAAELLAELEAEKRNNRDFDTYWALVAAWSESYRYEISTTRAQAENLIMALEDPTNGVLRWLKKYW